MFANSPTGPNGWACALDAPSPLGSTPEEVRAKGIRV